MRGVSLVLILLGTLAGCQITNIEGEVDDVKVKQILFYRVTDHDGGLRVVDEEHQLIELVVHIQRVKNKAAAQTGKVEPYRLGRFLDLDCHAIAGFQPQVREAASHPP